MISARSGSLVVSAMVTTTMRKIPITEDIEKSKAFDLVVIGGGSAGKSLATASAKLGARVALVDAVEPTPSGNTWAPFLGTCASVGCIPKKMLHSFAMSKDVLSDAASAWTMSSHITPASWHSIMDVVRSYINSLAWASTHRLRSSGVDTFIGTATLLPRSTQDGLHRIQLVPPTDGRSGSAQHYQVLEAMQVALATGTRPFCGDEYEAYKDIYITSDDFLVSGTDPRRTLIIGAGYIALELAGIILTFGNAVTLLVRSAPLRTFDQECVNFVMDDLHRRGLTVRTCHGVKAMERRDSGDIEVTFADGENESCIYDTVILAIGRHANVKNVTRELGIELDSNGKAIVDTRDETNITNVYAIGDCANWSPELQTTAAATGTLLAHRLYGESDIIFDRHVIPCCVFTPLEYACLGPAENEARKLHSDCLVYHSAPAPLQWQANVEERCGQTAYFKFIFAGSDARLIAAHIVAPAASEIIHGIAIAQRAACTLTDVLHTLPIHPTISEGISRLQQKVKPDDPPPFEADC